ncbi:unnamed protein product, partial [Vitis vinifera]|uniref:Uncharacterized protein n=1 Tax=Vitis vinifera TaxID=29760 RepID=D7SJQ6_VITVI
MGTLEQVFGVSLCSYGEQCQAFTRLSWIAPKTIRWPSLLIQVVKVADFGFCWITNSI